MSLLSSKTARKVLICAAFGGVLIATGCTPTVQVSAPKEPITINLNIKLDAEVRVKLEESAQKDIKSNPGLF